MSLGSVSPLAPNRSARRRERTRSDLLSAAIQVLSEKGLHHTKITDIAAAADVGVGTFYLHFPTKEALFDAVVEDAVGRLILVVEQAHESTPTAIDKIRAGSRAFFQFARENREVFRIMFGHAASYDAVIRRAQELFATDIAEMIRAGIATGELAPIDAAVAAQASVGMATQVVIWWLDHEAVPIETLESTLEHLTLRGLLPLAPEGSHP